MNVKKSCKSLRRVSRMVPEQPFFPSNNGQKSSAAVSSEKTDTTRHFARMWHRAVRKDRHDHVQRTTDVDAPSCRQKRHTRKTSVLPRGIRNVALLDCDTVPLEKTDAFACNEQRMLMRHHAVRKDKHEKARRKARYQTPDKTTANHLQHLRIGCGGILAP